METTKTNSVKSNIITEEEYKLLTEDEKKLYIPYNPTYGDKATMFMVKQANAQMELLNQYGPVFDQMVVMPNQIPLENIEKMVSMVENMVRLLDPINALASVPVIGTLVKPLVSLINAIFQVIGMLFYMVFVLGQGKEMFLDKPIESFNNVDWDGMKEKMDEMDNIEKESNMDVDVDASKFSEDAKKVYKGNVESLKQCVETTKTSLKAIDASAGSQKVMVEEVYPVYTFKGFFERCMKGFSNLGIDYSPLLSPTDEEMERFRKQFPDPSKKCDEMAQKLNAMTQEKYYIKEEKK